MGYEYITVDSKHRKYHERKSEIQVNLSSPILHAKSVRCVAFSSPNEFYNVLEGNNSITIVVYNLNNNTSTQASYTIPPALYSIDDLIAKLNIEFQTPVSSTTAVLTRLSSGKVQIQMTHATNQNKRAIIYYPNIGKTNDPFFQSIIYRLGFGRSQISDDNAPQLIQGDGNSPPNALIDTVHTEGQVQETTFTADPYNFLIWTVTSTNVVLNTKEGHYIGYESLCSHLFLTSDLVRDFHSTVKDSANDLVFTTQRNILQKIDVNVNIHSYIHYRSSLTESFTHSLSGQPITHFTISLTDDHHNLFEGASFKNFSCILMFETHDNLPAHRLNEQVIEHNQRSIFLAEHNC
jgi:hypothetical protein